MTGTVVTRRNSVVVNGRSADEADFSFVLFLCRSNAFFALGFRIVRGGIGASSKTSAKVAPTSPSRRIVSNSITICVRIASATIATASSSATSSFAPASLAGGRGGFVALPVAALRASAAAASARIVCRSGGASCRCLSCVRHCTCRREFRSSWCMDGGGLRAIAELFVGRGGFRMQRPLIRRNSRWPGAAGNVYKVCGGRGCGGAGTANKR